MKTRMFSRLTKYLMIVGLSILVINIALGIIFIKKSSSALMSSIQSRMLDVANSAAAMLDGDAIEKIKSGDREKKEYQDAYNILKRFLDNIQLKYIYSIKDMGNKKFVFLIDPSEDDPGEYGSPVVTTDELFKASQGNAAVSKEPYEDNWGSFYSAFSPVFNSAGNVVAIVAVDFSSEWYEQQVSDYIKTVIITGFFSLFVICALTFTITKIDRSRFRNVFASLNLIKDEINQLIEVIINLTSFRSKKNVITKLDTDINKVYDTKGLRNEIALMQNNLLHKVDNIITHAYVDNLTFLNNQAGYIKASNEIDKKIAKGDGISFIIAVFDICHLKNINDNYGYETGNMAILDAANLLKSVFDQDNIYHYDSDEFAGIFHDKSEDDIKLLFEKLENRINKLNQTPNLYKMQLAISKGSAVYNSAMDADCNDVFKRAEIAMYNDKLNYYKQFDDCVDGRDK